MERTMTVEEKIRRAEQIYERRKQGIDKPIETINISKNNKKDIRLLRKMIIQILVSALIYCVIYITEYSCGSWYFCSGPPPCISPFLYH